MGISLNSSREFLPTKENASSKELNFAPSAPSDFSNKASKLFDRQLDRKSFLNPQVPKRHKISHQTDDMTPPLSRLVSNILPKPEAEVFSKSINIECEFQKINVESDKLIKDSQYTMLEGKKSSNKNRYTDVLPYDKNIVKANGNYFNASFITYGSDRPTYIATQAPIPSTFSDFWSAVIESKSSVIVMLTKFIERNYQKASIYWPQTINSPEYFDHNIKITLIQKDNTPILEKRTFKIEKDNLQHNVTHFHFLNWPDNGVATLNEFDDLLKEVEKIQTSTPLFVHCSAGIGRAGTFITAHALRADIRKHLPVNIAEKVIELRKQRAFSVQTKEQYRLICDSISDFIEQRKLYHLSKINS